MKNYEARKRKSAIPACGRELRSQPPLPRAEWKTEIEEGASTMPAPSAGLQPAICAGFLTAPAFGCGLSRYQTFITIALGLTLNARDFASS
jgi:hypothetical protein